MTQDVLGKTGETLKTIGLSEHYPYLDRMKDDGTPEPPNPEEMECVNRMETNSVFRLVSTGVDVDNRIKSASSVQIQHVESKGFLIKDEEKSW